MRPYNLLWCLSLSNKLPDPGLEIKKKSPRRLLATNWRNIVARCKFLVASLYNVNEAAHSISLASDI